MGKFINLEGRTFGMLTVLKRAENRNNRVFWTCKCECGNVKDIRASSLLSGATHSCGCMQAYTYKPKNNKCKNQCARVNSALEKAEFKISHYEEIEDKCS